MSQTTPTLARTRTAAVRRVVDLARLAPSVDNTQPWHWRSDENRLELWTDRSRSLPAADPDGRDLMLSCGCALHHAVVAARALGFDAAVTRLPDSRRSELLARVQLDRGLVPADASLDLAALRERCTDRRRFTSWPVPEGRLVKLARHASSSDVSAISWSDPGVRFRLELLLEGVRGQQFADERARLLESSDGLIVLATDTDGPLDRLRAGEALSALWLEATRQSLSVVPLSQLVVDPLARAALRRELQGAHPQILVRLGWQQIGRSGLRRTSRRPLHEVLST